MTLDDLETWTAETHSCGKKSYYGAHRKHLDEVRHILLSAVDDSSLYKYKVYADIR